jgi:hypothetical protein
MSQEWKPLPPPKPEQYMDENNRTLHNYLPQDNPFHNTFIIPPDQVAIRDHDGQWNSTCNHINDAVLYFIDPLLNRLQGARATLMCGGMPDPGPVFWTFEAPDGTFFKVIDKRPEGEETPLKNDYCLREKTKRGFVVENSGEEFFCKVHGGHDSVEVLGTYIDRWPENTAKKSK